MIKKLVFGLALLMACQTTNVVPISNTDAMCIEDAGVESATSNVIVDVGPKHQNILIIGDSQARYAKWQIKKIQRPNETIFVDDKGGTTILWWNNKHFREEMAKYPNVDVVVIFLGTNNFNFTFLQPHQDILDVLHERRLKCIWAGPTKVDGRKHVINKLIKDAVSGTCSYVDTEELDIPLADGVHPTPQGTIKWLQEIWKVKDSL